MKYKTLAISWQLSEYFGWGIFGLNIVRELTKSQYMNPVCLSMNTFDLSEASKKQIKKSLVESDSLKNQIIEGNKSGKEVILNDAILISAYGNDFVTAPPSLRVRGNKNIGFIFFENSSFGPAGMSVAKNLDYVLVGSRWNMNVLKDLGYQRVAYVMQGVDVEKFSGVKRSKKYKDRFVIFSGGKLEYRKGQDIVLAAFKIFQQRHPDALLVTLWGNKWPQVSRDLIASPYKTGIPNIKSDGSLDLSEWTQRYGVPSSSVIHLDFIQNSELPEIYADVDVALFPNRAEGGTNLVAMELMASGVPSIISNNTGHMDIAYGSGNLLLSSQKIYQNHEKFGWGESSLDEILEKLEFCYANRAKATELGSIGRDFMSHYSWSNQIQKMSHVVEAVV